MRGFPLLSTLLIAAGFALAWWPMQRSIEVSAASAEPDLLPEAQSIADEIEDHGRCGLRIYASTSWQTLRIKSLDDIIVDSHDVSSIDLAEVELPTDPAGFDLWVEAKFPEASERVALAIEIENPNGEIIQRTLWSDGGTLADSVFFQAQAN